MEYVRVVYKDVPMARIFCLSHFRHGDSKGLKFYKPVDAWVELFCFNDFRDAKSFIEEASNDRDTVTATCVSSSLEFQKILESR